jgi:eukaryotic-like serine/threonine-protein kinase
VSDERLIAERYRLVRPIGSGGMGVVWQGYDERLHRKVAVKRLALPAELSEPQTTQATRLVVREGRIAAKLQHPNVIAVYDVVEDAGQSFLIMEYLPSTSLAEVLGQHGRLAPWEAARIGAEVADALAAAHEAGIVHRDVKPGNVLLTAEGTAKVTDFGIARAVEDATATATATSGLLAGTPAYLSPEVARGLPATYASDVFSLGATLYTAIEGTPPAGSAENAMALLYRVAHGELAPPTQAGPLTSLLTGMLSVDPARRPSMAAVHDRLKALAAQPKQPTQPTQPDQPVATPREPKQSVRRGIIPAAAALVLVAVIAGILALSSGTRDQRAGSTAPSSAAPSSTTPSSTTVAPETSTSQPIQPPASQPPAGSPGPTTTADAARQSPAATITAYYGMMPGDLQRAWAALTPKFQQHPAGGYGGYQAFWGRIRAVHASNVNPVSGNVVETTVEYNFKDGRVVRERHRYTLVDSAGRWLIDQVAVLSSQTL